MCVCTCVCVRVCVCVCTCVCVGGGGGVLLPSLFLVSQVKRASSDSPQPPAKRMRRTGGASFR